LSMLDHRTRFVSRVIAFQVLASHVTFPHRDIPNKSPEGRIRAGIARGNPSMKVLNQKAEDGSYRYPLHGDLPNIKTWEERE